MKKVPDNLLLGCYRFDDDSKYVCLKKMLLEQKNNGDLVVPLGVSSDNEFHYINFDDISCLLVSGETGSGKSIFLDSIIISLVLRNGKDKIRFVMMDPKKIELSYYNSLPHMKGNVINDASSGILRLLEVKEEYNKRKKILLDEQIQNIELYNKSLKSKKLYHLFVVIDESCDIMKDDRTEKILLELIEDCDMVGIHFIIATNSIWEDYFSKKFIDAIKYKVTFDMATLADALIIGDREVKDLESPGIAIATSKKQKLKYKLQTPYISDTDIMRVVDYYSSKNSVEKK